MKEALFYEKLQNSRVKCTLCPHYCRLTNGKIGICGVRQNQDGILYTLVYEKAIATHVDPIEKKPLFHVYPGSRSFSLATVGCNFTCDFCQNHDISQMPRDSGHIAGEPFPALRVVRAAQETRCKTIACTYTEPVVFFEYAYDIAKLASRTDILTVFVTNGFVTQEPLEYIAPYLSAANVDLKGWDETFYRKVVGGDLRGVLNALKVMKKLGIWVEITTLVVPGFVDDENDLREIALFIKNELGPETPWHISRFYPRYKCLDVPVTSVQTLRRAREIGMEVGLRYVYSGNVPGDVGENTFCYNCSEMLIERYGFQIMKNRIQSGKCPKCGVTIDGIGM
jgi:pyruvate formate lyase activating enzyme